MDCSLPGSSVHRISQARILEWVAISFSNKQYMFVTEHFEIIGTHKERKNVNYLQSHYLKAKTVNFDKYTPGLFPCTYITRCVFVNIHVAFALHVCPCSQYLPILMLKP